MQRDTDAANSPETGHRCDATVAAPHFHRTSTRGRLALRSTRQSSALGSRALQKKTPVVGEKRARHSIADSSESPTSTPRIRRTLAARERTVVDSDLAGRDAPGYLGWRRAAPSGGGRRAGHYRPG